MKLPEDIILEACVETLDEAMAAYRSGAHRLELCSRLDLEGLTPSDELIEEVTSAIPIPVKIMIRNRPGDFLYSEQDMQEMLESINDCKRHSIDGIVIGAITKSASLDLEKIQRLADLAFPLKVTVHKVIDLVNDPISALEDLIALGGINSILTSGGANNALEGSKKLREMVLRAGDKIKIIVAGKVTSENLEDIHRLIGASEYHGRKIVPM